MKRARIQPPVPEEVISLAMQTIKLGRYHLEKTLGVQRSVAVRAVREARARLLLKSPSERAREYREILDKYAESTDVSQKTLAEISRETGVNFRSVQRWRGVSGLVMKPQPRETVEERFEELLEGRIGSFVVIRDGRVYSRNRPEDAEFFNPPAEPIGIPPQRQRARAMG